MVYVRHPSSLGSEALASSLECVLKQDTYSAPFNPAAQISIKTFNLGGISQFAKKVVSRCRRLVDFAVRLVDF